MIRPPSAAPVPPPEGEPRSFTALRIGARVYLDRPVLEAAPGQLAQAVGVLVEDLDHLGAERAAHVGPGDRAPEDPDVERVPQRLWQARADGRLSQRLDPDAERGRAALAGRAVALAMEAGMVELRVDAEEGEYLAQRLGALVAQVLLVDDEDLRERVVVEE